MFWLGLKRGMRVLQVQRIMEIMDYFATQDWQLDRFDRDLFHRLVEKVKVQLMVEVVIVFKAGVEVREIL